MDRDIVNAIHLLYRIGPMDWQTLRQKLWCGPDSAPSVAMFARSGSDPVALPDEVLRFLKAVEDQLANLPKPDFVFSFPLSQSIRDPGQPRPCFVAMPYRTDWFEPVKRAIVDAAAASNFDAEVSLDLRTPGSILDQIWHGIRRADVVVADVTGGNPNVFYEIGLAHALGKEVIVLQQIATEVPFDIAVSRIIAYDPKNLATLERALLQAFGSVSARYPHEGPEPRF